MKISRLKISLLVLLALVCVILPHITTAQNRFSEAERKIIQITDERRDADSLIHYLKAADIRTAWRAAIGIGNIGDTTVRARLSDALLHESRDTIADAEAWSLAMLGPHQESAEALSRSIASHPSAHKVVAYARVVPKDHAGQACDLISDLVKSEKISSTTAARAYIELSLRKILTAASYVTLERLAADPSAATRWRVAYALARSGDSAELAPRVEVLKDLLLDQGSVSTRMFAALAFGRLHTPEAKSILSRSFRSEWDWRVQVNILQALGRFPRFDSTTFSVIRYATLRAERDSTLAIKVGQTAMSVLDQMIGAGKLAAKDSAILRAWLSDFNESEEKHQDIAPQVGAATLTPAARLNSPSIRYAINGFAQAGDAQVRNEAIRAIAFVPDSMFFAQLIESMPRVGPTEQLPRLEVLDTLWQYAKRNPDRMRQFEVSRWANIYRHMLIHAGEAVGDPSVVATTMEHLKDSLILNTPELRAEATKTLVDYLARYNSPRGRDALLAVTGALQWIGDTTNDVVPTLKTVYSTASSWNDRELTDTIRSVFASMRIPTKSLAAGHALTSKIDWGLLESIPERMTINGKAGTIELRLDPYYAPLTCMNMVRLAKQYFFTNQIVHRVVPNFVIQSGDPTGTGWGGPGFMMRTELSPLEYDQEGAVGMASSGKDTEGSQWFITDCPTPHLTDHYTIWARVQSGMDAEYRTLQGDKIESIISFK